MPQYPVREIRYEDLPREPFRCAEPTIYAVLKAGVRFEFLVKRQPRSGRAVVFGTGTMSFPREDWPCFSRHTWMGSVPENCIFYFDPTLYLGAVELAWGYGTNERWFLAEIGEILSVILDKLGVRREDTLMMGSSGGGFTSILLATLLRTRCQAINPQIDFRRYKESAVKRLGKAVLQPGEEWIESRADAVALMRAEQYIPYLHIIQNILVEEDIADHILPLINELCGKHMACGYDRIRLDFYHNIEGHNGMPPKDKCLNYIRQDLEAPFPEASAGPLEIVPVEPVPAEDAEPVRFECTGEYLLSGRDLTVLLTSRTRKKYGERYAYYLYRDGQILERTGYFDRMKITFRALEPGKYKVKYFVKAGAAKESFMMEEIAVS